MLNEDLIKKADTFSHLAHIWQLRKYTNEPYINHPREVAYLVRQIGGSTNMICAALLHDVIEDTDVTYEDIESRFGKEIAGYVYMLTEDNTKGNRAYRKEVSRNKISMSCGEVKTIKLADLISNTCTIAMRDPKFSKVYLNEKLLLLDVLKEGNTSLWNFAKEQCEFFIKINGE